MAQTYAPNSFNSSIMEDSVLHNQFSRRWGSNNPATAVDPYITGYHFIKFRHFPSLTNMLAEAGHSYAEGGEKRVLESSVTSVTIPGATVNKAEFQGLGGIRWFYPTNADWDNTITLRFTEWAGAQIHAIIHAWVKMISDYRAGVMRTNQETNTAPTKADFTASMFYWTTRPDGLSVDYHSLATGMFPTKDPTDLFGHDLTAIDKLELDIDFSVDVLWHESFTRRLCQEFANVYFGKFDNGVITNYGNFDSEANNGREAVQVDSIG